MSVLLTAVAVVVGVAVVILLMSLKVVPEYERAVKFRLGHLQGAKGPGLIIVLPIFDRIVRVRLRTVALEIPVQELVTKDNVTVKVNGVTYYVVRDPVKAVMSVEDYRYATAQVSQVTLLTVLRQVDLDALLREREAIGGRLRALIDQTTEPWGVEVTMVEIKDVELPEQMRRAMAREAESERERRAKVIHARGELEAAESLGLAAARLEEHPAALQLRTLSTLAEIAVEKNSTIVFPLPFEVMRVFEGMAQRLERELRVPAEPAAVAATAAHGTYLAAGDVTAADPLSPSRELKNLEPSCVGGPAGAG